MAKHIVKCLYCGEAFDASVEEFVKPRTNRYAHKYCFEKTEQQKSKEESDKEKLEEYIKQLFEIDRISPKIAKQIKDFHINKNYSYSGIYKTLKFFFEIKGNSIEKANGGIGIVPYVYDKALLYWRALWEAQEKNKNVEIHQYMLPVREIRIRPPEREPMKHTRKLFDFLNEVENDE